jgi:phage baseplate assembly protein W
MPTYIGFSTQNACKPRTATQPSGVDGGPGNLVNPVIPGKKYRLTDEQLIVQDFINALNIPQGQKPGNPGYGTTLWGFVFEPNTADTQFQLEQEIRRVANLDPRLLLNSVIAYPDNNGILLELELAIKPSNQVDTLRVYFDRTTNTAFGT